MDRPVRTPRPIGPIPSKEKPQGALALSPYGAFHHRPEERAPVGGARVQVTWRIDRLLRRGCRFPNYARIHHAAVQSRFGLGNPMRARARADHAYMGVAGPSIGVQIVERRDAGIREVAAARRKLLETPAPARRPRREADLDDELVVAEHGGQRAYEELVRTYAARSCFPPDMNLGVAGDRDAGQLGGRIGVGEAAAHGAAVADLVMRDMLNRRGEERLRALQLMAVQDVAPTHSCAQDREVLSELHALEARYFPKVDQQRRRRQAEGHGGNEALAAGERLGAASRSEQLDRLVERAGRGVFELGQLHRYSGRMLAVLTTFVQRSMSLCWYAASSSGVLPIGVVPSPLSRSRRSVAVTAWWIALESLPVTSAGIPAGPKIAYHEVTSKPGYPASATVGRSMPGTRCAVAVARAFSLPDFT